MAESQIHELIIRGLDCADCAARLEQELSSLANVRSARIDFMNSLLKVEFTEANPDLSSISKIVRNHGFALQPVQQLQRSTLIVTGMDCPNESRPIQQRLEQIPGIHSLKFNLVANTLIIEHQVPLTEIQQVLTELGFKSELAERVKHQDTTTGWQKYQMLVLTVIAGVFAVVGAGLHFFHFPESVVIPLLVLGISAGGYPIAKKGITEARNLRLGMNFLMALAVLGAMIIGEWTEAAFVIFLFALAQLLESYSVARARKSIQSLVQLAPNLALLKSAQGNMTVPVETVKPGDTIIIKPGERIPLDGIVTFGQSTVNQAPITGESMPVEKSLEDPVYAGTINEKGILEVQVSKSSEDSTIARIIHLVAEAQAQKAPVQTFVEKFARYYTPIVVFCAFLLALLPPLFFGAKVIDWFYRALVLLVISCPCALVISTPVTIISGLTNAARNGILIKGGAFLENFSQLKALAFDKTGTLTIGKPQVRSVIPLDQHDEMELLAIAASIEANSEHPLARAVVEYALAKNIQLEQVEKFEAISGKGVRAVINGSTYLLGNHRLFEENGWCNQEIHHHLDRIDQRSHTVVILGKENTAWGIITLADTIRDSATRAIKLLQRAGIQKTVMLTGDNQQTATAIAREIGIDAVKAELLPEDKVAAIKELCHQYQKVGMVGDGINDAPALATATMGISLGYSGTGTALETADIALMNDDLVKLVHLKKISQKTNRIIKQNITIALFLKGLFMLLAIYGLATLWMAVFADMGASLMVLFNGLRALKGGT